MGDNKLNFTRFWQEAGPSTSLRNGAAKTGGDTKNKQTNNNKNTDYCKENSFFDEGWLICEYQGKYLDSSSFSKVLASVAMQLGDSRCFRKHIKLSATITVTLSKCRLKKIPTAALSEVRADEYIPGYLKKIELVMASTSLGVESDSVAQASSPRNSTEVGNGAGFLGSLYYMKY